MSYQPYLIANYRDGIDQSVRPWLLPAQAFQDIEDGYLNDGVVNKRSGIQSFGSLNGRQVTGIYNFVTNTGEKEIIATDDRRVFRFNTITHVFDMLDAVDVWSSNRYMWFSNFGVTNAVAQNTLFMTNFANNMRSYTTGSATTTAFTPQYGAAPTDVVTNALFIFTIRNRLLLLNTIEGALAATFPQRARWSQADNPNVFDEITPGRGGFVDAPTGDFIIGARNLKDYLVVYFTNSTWILRPTSDPALPFRWDKVNNFRACDASFGTLSYDSFVMSFGQTGILACDGINLQRIDQNIQYFVTNEVDSENFNLLYSDRNFAQRRSWTLYPVDDDTGINSKALIRSDEGGWSKYNISLSVLGHGEAFQDWTFADFTGVNDKAFNQFSNDELWNSFYFQDQGNIFLGGDYEGNIYVLEVGGDDDGEEIPFYLLGAGWNPYKEQGIEAQLGYVDIYTDVDVYTDLTVKFYLNDDVDPYKEQVVSLIPEKGYVEEITNILLTNPATIVAPQHGLQTGQQVYISGVNGTLEINGGVYNVTVVDTNQFTLDGINATAFSAYTGGGIVTLYNPQDFSRIWKRAYAGGIGYTHTVEIEALGTNQNIAIHSITPWFRPAGTRVVNV